MVLSMASAAAFVLDGVLACRADVPWGLKE